MQEEAKEESRKYHLDITTVANVAADVAHLKDALPELVACIMRVLSTDSSFSVTGTDFAFSSVL